MSFRSLKKGWSQFLAIIAIGTIAVTLFVGLLANAQSFENQVSQCYQEGNLADIWVTTEKYDAEDESQIKTLVGDKGQVESRFYYPAEIGTHEIYMTVSKDYPTISKPYGNIEESSSNTEDYFCYVDDNFKAKSEEKSSANYYVLGQQISMKVDISSIKASFSSYISILDSYLLDGGTNIFNSASIDVPLEVTGFMQYPENIEKSTYSSSSLILSDGMLSKSVNSLLTSNFTSTGVSLIYAALNSTLSTGLENAERFTAPNQYLIKADSEEEVDGIQADIESYYVSKASSNLSLITQRSNMPFYQTVNNDVKQARQFTFVFPFVFFAVAILVILTTLSQMVMKERTQIGTMKAIGLTKREIYMHYMSITLLLVGIGTIIGEILGPLIIPGILGQKYNLLYSLPAMQYTFPVLYGILTAVIFLFVSALATFLICYKEISLKPVDSMRPSAPSFKATSHLNFKKQKVAFLSIKMAFRNIRTSLLKSCMVIIGVMGCTALLCCGFGIEDTVYYGIDHDVAKFNNSDISSSFQTSQDASAKAVIEGVEGVDNAELYSVSNSKVYIEDGTRVNNTLYLISPVSDIDLAIPENTIAISEKTAEKTGASLGDVLYFELSGTIYSGQVGLIFEAFFYNYIYIHSDADFLNGYSLTYQGAWINCQAGYDAEQVNDSISSSLSYVSSSFTKKAFKEKINDVMSGVLIMTNAVKVFAILLAVVVLYNLALMNFTERTRDIATLKVLGFSKKEIALSLLFETMALTALGVICGLALGYPFMLLVLKTNVVEIVKYLYTINVSSYVYSFLLTYVVALLVNIYFASKTNKIPMVESLKSVE